MTKTLKMPFRNAAGKEVNFTLANPKDGLTKAEELKEFADSGYTFAEKASSATRWVFRRQLS